MGMNSIDAMMLKKAFLAGANGLESKKEWINELNVFPVPDGDTGTNMTMTIMSAAREVMAIEEPTMESLAKAISSGSLRGARGNSGVILSQLFRGFTKEIKDVDVITTATLTKAFVRASETAYKAVMKPKEGTILTVARGMADKAVELVTLTEDILFFVEQVINHGDYVLSKTPEMLPVLKQAGVVDSGGQGLMQVMKGAYDGLAGKEIQWTIDMGKQTAPRTTGVSSSAEADIKFGYCTEFIINLEKHYDDKSEQELKGYLQSIGDSLVVVSDDGLVKIHVHTNNPGLAIQKGLGFGSLSRMKIDNMREEHEERLLQEMLSQSKEKKAVGFIAVSIGDGLTGIFEGIGVDYLIEGGQTMNPSTEDMLNAVSHVNAETIYILPNNKNIILAAEQAKSLVTDKQIIVVPSKTIPQGITAVINYVPDLPTDQNAKIMEQEMNRVRTGQITYAVRNTMIDHMEIKQGDIMGIGDQGMLAVGKTIAKTTLDTLMAMVDESSELVSIYYGSDVSEEDAQEVLVAAEEACPGCEIELHNGGQPIYYYILSVE